MKISQKDLYRILIVIAITLTLAASVYAVVGERHYFTNRNLRQIGSEIRAYGIWSPIIIFSLIVLSTVIPPLPVPIAFLEISAGIIFGFWPGIILVWGSQVASALTCFALSKKIGRLFVDRISKSQIFAFFKQFVEKRRALAIFVLRATMSSPFNVSYLAGLMQMNGWEFFAASALGVIPEAVLFVFLGTLINERVRFHLWYIFLLLLLLNYLPTLILISVKYLRRRKP